MYSLIDCCSRGCCCCCCCRRRSFTPRKSVRPVAHVRGGSRWGYQRWAGFKVRPRDKYFLLVFYLHSVLITHSLARSLTPPLLLVCTLLLAPLSAYSLFVAGRAGWLVLPGRRQGRIARLRRAAQRLPGRQRRVATVGAPPLRLRLALRAGGGLRRERRRSGGEVAG